MFNKKRKNCVTLYGVFHTSDGYVDTYEDADLLCVTATEEDAYEYITKKVYKENEGHYKMWCKVHNKEDDAEAFEEYISTVLAMDETLKFAIVKMYYTLEEISSFIRCMLNYKLVGASYESELEQSLEVAFNSQEEDEDSESSITNDKVC